jgi:hypothetical protein
VDDQSAAEQRGKPSGSGVTVDAVLEAKYLDYCSARLAEVFLSLDAERIYGLVEEAAAEADLNPADLGFRRMVKLVTDKLTASVPLPDLEEWAADYRDHPERYDPYLLGFWEESTAGPSGGLDPERS